MSAFRKIHNQNTKLLDLRKFPTNIDRPLDQIDIFQDLQPQIIVQRWVIRQKLVHDRQGLSTPLPPDERPQPAVDEEYLSAALVVRQLPQCSFQIRQSNLRMPDRIPRPERRLDPAFAYLLVRNEIARSFS